MRKTLIVVLLLSMLGSSCQYLPYPGEDTPTTVQPNSILVAHWVALHLRLIRNTRGVQHISYSRHFAYTGIALYQSVMPSAFGYRSLAGQLNGLGSLPSAPEAKKLHPVASANAALAQMMRSFYGSNSAHAALIDSLETVWQQSLAAAKIPCQEESAAYGKQVAEAIVAWANTDNSNKAFEPYTPPTGAGLWQPTPPASTAASAPYWGNNRPIVASSQRNATLPAPMAFSTEPASPFHAMVSHLYETFQQLSNEQRAIALFWDDAPSDKYVSAFGHWISVLTQVALAKKLPLVKTAAAYAKTAIAMNDACIATWKMKYTYNLIRPVTYIRQNIDSEWLPTIVTPAHPEYPAAHATLSAAAAFALTDALGSNVSFTDHTYDDIGMQPRSFPTFEAAGREAGISRLYGGIHYQLSIDAGTFLGKRVAQNVVGALQFRK